MVAVALNVQLYAPLVTSTVINVMWISAVVVIPARISVRMVVSLGLNPNNFVNIGIRYDKIIPLTGITFLFANI